MLTENKGRLTFSSGRTIEPNCGIVGINHRLEIHHGFDGDLHTEYNRHAETPEDEGLTAEEIRELSDYMIARWQEAKTNADILSPAKIGFPE